MGYLSCRAESSISTCRSISAIAPTSSSSRHHHFDAAEAEIRSSRIQHFHYSDLESATNNFSPSSLLGRGSHGAVFKARLHSFSVAVKRPSSTANSADVDNEIGILSQIHTPRIVNLLGFSPSHPHPLLVFELMPNGTLFDLLHNNPRPPSWPRRLRLALHSALALLTLHSLSPPIIHRDVKSANILLDRNLNARLADFGLATLASSCRRSSTPPAGTLGYLDPAYVTPEDLSTKTDVFSFGILLFEIMSGRKAIDVAHSPPSVVEWAVPLLRKGKVGAIFDPRVPPPRDSRVMRQLAVLAATCVRGNDERRPTMQVVVEQLEVLSKAVSAAAKAGWIGNPCSVVETEGTLLKAKDESKASREERRREDREMDGGGVKKPAMAPGSAGNSSVKTLRPPLGNNGKKVAVDAETKRGTNLMELMARPERELIELCGGRSSLIGRVRPLQVTKM